MSSSLHSSSAIEKKKKKKQTKNSKKQRKIAKTDDDHYQKMTGRREYDGVVWDSVSSRSGRKCGHKWQHTQP